MYFLDNQRFVVPILLTADNTVSRRLKRPFVRVGAWNNTCHISTKTRAVRGRACAHLRCVSWDTETLMMKPLRELEHMLTNAAVGDWSDAPSI